MGAALLGAAREAFTGGLHVAAALSAVLLAGVAVVIAVTLRHVPPTGADGHGSSTADDAENVQARMN